MSPLHPRRRGAWRWPALLVGLLLIAGCAGHAPEATASRFYRAVAHGDTTTAMALIHFDDASGEAHNDAVTRHMHTQLALLSMQAEITLAGGLEDIDIDRVDTLDARRKSVHVTLHFGNGRTQTDRITLVETGTGWMIAA